MERKSGPRGQRKKFQKKQKKLKKGIDKQKSL